MKNFAVLGLRRTAVARRPPLEATYELIVEIANVEALDHFESCYHCYQ
jgi:hypothetical protein